MTAQREFVYAWRTGRIEFGPTVPDGAIGLGRSGPRIRRRVEAEARLAYDNTTLLVPGIPEAENDDQAVDALVVFRNRIRMTRQAGAGRRQ